MALVRAGADRQHMHEKLRDHSLRAWEVIAKGKPNPLAHNLAADTEMLRYLQPARLSELMKAEDYVGTAVERAEALAGEIRRVVGGV
jgi:adenylosuccinate lyase